ncbi:MAG: excinuclease ABC subunit UvrB [Candidatus Sungbacteria bacterium]|nr:excinuclease ABC subunit UvrB [Candidatus Sungbacteria bacterium]
MPFTLKSQFSPAGDQPRAIEQLSAWLKNGAKHQTLLGVTGSGKTFTIANVVARVRKPTLVISHNKTLAAQLYQEFKEFFPDNAVHYFVSYYDYYQPEAYIPQSDTYIEKDAKINETIDALRHSSTASLLTRKDVLIVASVSCIYGVGSPEEYEKVSIELAPDDTLTQKELVRRLILLQYARNPIDPRQGHFRTRENRVEIYLPSGEEIISIEFEKNKISMIEKHPTAVSFPRKRESRIKNNWIPDQVGNDRNKVTHVRIFPAKHFVTPTDKLKLAILHIKNELEQRLAELNSRGKILEAARLKQRTEFDMEMLVATGYVNGIENYSRHLEFRDPGTPPHTLLDYFRYANGDDFLTVIDESHATIPQLRGMYAGDQSRKQTLINYGFRLPSAADNRPLMFDEFNRRVNETIYVSATPAAYELQMSSNRHPERSEGSQRFFGLRPQNDEENHIAEQIIRPTGILDPKIEVRPTKNQVLDVIAQIKKRIAKKERSLVMALTKRLAEDIAEYLTDAGIKAEYLHSEIKTLDRPDILNKLRTGEHDVIVGINLLREGLDLPEVSFIAILDADKEGFLRNQTTLLQIIGRASRHTDGTVILYADTITGSMKSAINETQRRRKIQHEYNIEHDITPTEIKKEIRASMLAQISPEEDAAPLEGNAAAIIKELDREMKKASRSMDFERAALLRDKIKKYRA